MKNPVVLLIIIFIAAACGRADTTEMATETEPAAESSQDQFFANLTALCGETFSGQATYPDDPDHTLVDTQLKAHITSCGENLIEVDFLRDGDTWHATWVLEKREEGLHLYHDHVGDQDEDELGEDHNTGYGGYANEYGTGLLQFFPADDYTAQMLPEASTNVWIMQMDPEAGTFVYYLERHQEPRFKAELARVTD